MVRLSFHSETRFIKPTTHEAIFTQGDMEKATWNQVDTLTTELRETD